MAKRSMGRLWRLEKGLRRQRSGTRWEGAAEGAAPALGQFDVYLGDAPCAHAPADPAAVRTVDAARSVEAGLRVYSRLVRPRQVDGVVEGPRGARQLVPPAPRLPPAGGRGQNGLGALQRGLPHGLRRTAVPADDQRDVRPARPDNRDLVARDEHAGFLGGSHELSLSIGEKEPPRTDEVRAVRDPARGMFFGKALCYVEAEAADQGG